MANKQQIKAIALHNKEMEIKLKEENNMKHNRREQFKKRGTNKKKGEVLNENIADIQQQQQKAINTKKQYFVNITNEAGAFKNRKKQ